MNSNSPQTFIFPDTLRHKSPESVRVLLLAYGFSVQTEGGTKDSEIWSRRDVVGHWVVRIDSQGHDQGRGKRLFHHGSRPHYHKDWVSSDTELESYVRGYLPTAMVYSDEGVLLGQAGHMKGNDRQVALSHIKR